MSRWLIKADIAKTQVIENNNQTVVDVLEKNQAEEQQTPMCYDKNTYEGQEEKNKLIVEMEK